MADSSNRFTIAERFIPIGIDMNEKKNKKEHSTSRYDISGVVLRRGQEFSVIITFSQVYDNEKYRLTVIFKPLTWRHSSEIKIPVNQSAHGWSTKSISMKNQICLQVISSSDALIGKYAILLEISLMNRPEYSSLFQFDIDLYFLSNPWQEGDACELLSIDEINEYVMNEYGRIYMGSWDIPKCISWYFGQFQSIVLLTALAILNQEEASTNEKVDLALILRILSSKISSDSGTTINGIFPCINQTNPLLSQKNGYTSSPAILQRRFLLDHNGTNWQYAAIVCSLCRSLGIPCRIVTVFDAMTGQQQSMVSRNSDRTSYYVWNECWIRRDDLPKDFSGWQVVDSFHGENDNRVRCVGPCSVAGLKAGRFNLKWNSSEIKNLMNMMNVKVLTKSLKNDRDYEDITNDYISSERNIEERINSLEQDIEIDMEILDNLEFDDHLNLTVAINNRSDQVRTLLIEIKLNQINSTTTNHHNVYSPIQSYTQYFYLNPHQNQTIRIKLAENYRLWKEYFTDSLRIDIRARIKETDQISQTQRYILNEENMSMKLFFDDDVIEFGKSARLNIQINNVSAQSWNEGYITINGFGVFESFPIRRGSVSKRSILIPVEIVPLRKGISQVYVTLTTDSISLPTQTVLLEVIEVLPETAQLENPIGLKKSSSQDNVQCSANIQLEKETTNPIETTDVIVQTSEFPSNEQIEQSRLVKVPSLDSIVEKSQRTLPKIPSLDSLTDSKVQTNLYETRKLPKIPSLDNLTDTVSNSIAIDQNKNNHPIILSKLPSFDNSMEDIEFVKEMRLLSMSSLESITEPIPELIIIEEGDDRILPSAIFERKERKLFKIRSLDTPVETAFKISNDINKSNRTPDFTEQRFDMTKKLQEECPLTEPIKVTTTSIHNGKINEEEKKSEDLRSWLNQLLQRLNLPTEKDTDKKSTPVLAKQNDIKATTSTTKYDVIKDKIETVNKIEVLTNMDLKDWLENVRRQMITNFGKSIDQESNILLPDDVDLLTPTNIDDDLSKPVDEYEEVVIPLTSTSDSSFSSANSTNENESGYKPSDESLIDMLKIESIMKSNIPTDKSIDQSPIFKSRRNRNNAFSNVTSDIESVLSDVSHVTTASYSNSASDDVDEWPSRTRDNTLIEGRSTRSTTLTTIKNRESTSSEEISDDRLPKSFRNSSLTLYAEFLACKIIGSALYIPSNDLGNHIHAVSNPLYESS